MDFKIVQRQIIQALKQTSTTWKPITVVRFFKAYYKYYEHQTGAEHPRLKTETIQRIIERLDEYTIDEYSRMIPQYFATELDCDYSIAHFMSGDIREYRYEEIEG